MADSKLTRKKITVLTPVYNEEASLPLYEKSVAQVLLRHPDYEFHFLLIDDGSADRSWPIIRDMCARNPCFGGVRLSRNYGSHVALSAGFARANGDAVATLACDLQDPPEVVLEFLEKWESGARIVWGRRRAREDETWRIVASGIFERLLRRYAMPRGSLFTTGSFLLVDRLVADAFRQFVEHNRITFALVAWTGFEQATVEYHRKRRIAGVSGWNFARMIKALYDAFIGFSHVPIRMMTFIGVLIFVLTVPLAAYVLFSWWVGSPMRGWTSLMLILAVGFGIQFLLMGVMGEYLYRIYVEVMRRPLYFVSEETSNAGAGAGCGR